MVLVTPNVIMLPDWDYDPSMWYAAKAPISYFVNSTNRNSNEGCANCPEGASNFNNINHMSDHINPQTHWNGSCLNVHASPQFNSAVKCDSDFRIAEPKLKDDPIMDIIESVPQTYEFQNSGLKDENSSSIDFFLSTSSSELNVEIK